VIRRRFLKERRKGDIIRGDVLIPEGRPPCSVVILVHDFQGSRNWSFFPWLAGRLVTAGHAVVCFDFSHNGIGVDPKHFTELERFGANTLSLELEELRFILAEVLDGDLLPTSPRRDGLLGHGRGGAHAVLAAAGEVRIGALVTWAALSYFDRWHPLEGPSSHLSAAAERAVQHFDAHLGDARVQQRQG
jgi:dienelactone hydrolase